MEITRKQRGRVRPMAKSPAPLETAVDVPAKIGEQLQAITEFLTGFASSEKKDWILSFGYVLQRIRGGRFLETLLNELNQYREKGRIKHGYFQTDQGQTCLQELLDALDKDSPDEIRFKAMKAVLLVAASERHSSRADVLPQQLMRICRQLSSTEVLILTACHTIYKQHEWDDQISNNFERFVPLVTKKSGLEIDDLVLLNTDGLRAKRLIIKNSRTTILVFKLSPLGERLCQFIEAYQPEHS